MESTAKIIRSGFQTRAVEFYYLGPLASTMVTLDKNRTVLLLLLLALPLIIISLVFVQTNSTETEPDRVQEDIPDAVRNGLAYSLYQLYLEYEETGMIGSRHVSEKSIHGERLHVLVEFESDDCTIPKELGVVAKSCYLSYGGYETVILVSPSDLVRLAELDNVDSVLEIAEPGPDSVMQQQLEPPQEEIKQDHPVVTAQQQTLPMPQDDTNMDAVFNTTITVTIAVAVLTATIVLYRRKRTRKKIKV